jgi:tRNA-dihydrouridine synthase B
MKAYTNCDAVMIGRAAIGNPWIFAGMDRSEVSREQVLETILSHLESMLSFYGPKVGLVLFRKHAKRYLNPYLLTRQYRTELLNSETPAEFTALLDQITTLHQPQ